MVVKGFKHLWEQLPAGTQAAYGHRYLETCEYFPAWPRRSLVTPPPPAGRAGPGWPPSAHPGTKSTILLQRPSSSHPFGVTGIAAYTLLAHFPRSHYVAIWDAWLALLLLTDATIDLSLPAPAREMPACP